MSMNAYLEQITAHSYALTMLEATHVVVILAIYLVLITEHAMVSCTLMQFILASDLMQWSESYMTIYNDICFVFEP